MSDTDAIQTRLDAIEARQNRQDVAIERLESRQPPLASGFAASPLLVLALVAGATLLVMAVASHIHFGRTLRHLF
jgi:hypothetical protein